MDAAGLPISTDSSEPVEVHVTLKLKTVLMIGAALLLAGCGDKRASGSKPLAAGDALRASPNARAAPLAAGGTRYELGDYVVYRYSGAFTPMPVTVRERIVKKDGNRLVIDVVAQRGNDERHWQQVVTDTPENQKNNVVDELYEFVDGVPRKLANAKDEDLYRLYAWTVFMPDGKARDVHVSKSRATFAGRSFDCERTEGRNVWRGRPIRFEAFDCTDFVWTHGTERFWDEESAKDVSRIEVVEFGRESLAR